MPNTLVALCLNTGGLERVQSSHALEVFADVFTTRTYQRYACRLCLLKQMQDMVAPHGCVACGLSGRGSTAKWAACVGLERLLTPCCQTPACHTRGCSF